MFLKIYFLSTETIVNSVTNFMLISLTQKNIIENIQYLNVIKRKFTNVLI